MSFNRLTYDNCAYQQTLNQSVGTLAYQLDPSRYHNCSACRMELGLVGGNNVSQIKGNLVDLESDLKGITRLGSKCPQLKYLNPCPNGDMNTCKPQVIQIRGTPTTRARSVDLTPQHLPSCQMIRYKPISLPPAIRMPTCGN